MIPNHQRVNAKRFRANFESLAKIGTTGKGGIFRPTFSPAHLEARKWFRERAIAANLDFHIDSAGNHSAILYCGQTNARTLLLGSHLDSVPNGGRFDGALGVLAAFEVLQSVQDTGISLPFHLEAIDFTDEEGTLVGLLGSNAVVGKLTLSDLQEPRSGRQMFLKSMANAGLTEKGLLCAHRDPQSLVGYLELHIEQGDNLLDKKADIGIVTDIVGIGSYQITFIGIANHAGTTSMKSRLDAAQGASAFTLAVRDLVLKDFPDCVANVGNMCFEPGVFNIIPERAIASLEYRAPSKELLDNLKIAILTLAQDKAETYGLGLETEFLGNHSPASMDFDFQETFKRVAHTLGLESIPMASGAGHDAQSLAHICPSGMIFVPSAGGISHSPNEFTAWSDCVNGANMLLLSVFDLSNQE